MGKIIVDRELLQLPLTGIELGVLLSAMDLGTIYRDQILLTDKGIYFNMMGRLPNQKQREEVGGAIDSLIEGGHLVATSVGHGSYVVDCQRSFNYDLTKLTYGGRMLIYEDVQKIMQSGQSWQGVLRYYLMLAAHMSRDNKCSYSRQYFADKLNMSELSLTKYNGILKDLGVISIAHRKNMPSYYYLT